MVERFYRKNALAPSGLQFNPYWTCHPFYELQSALIPLNYYKLGISKLLEEVDRLRKEYGDLGANLICNRNGGDNVYEAEPAGVRVPIYP